MFPRTLISQPRDWFELEMWLLASLGSVWWPASGQSPEEPRNGFSLLNCLSIDDFTHSTTQKLFCVGWCRRTVLFWSATPNNRSLFKELQIATMEFLWLIFTYRLWDCLFICPTQCHPFRRRPDDASRRDRRRIKKFYRNIKRQQ